MTYPYNETEFREAVDQMKQEILADMGRVRNSRGDLMPVAIRDYSTLHDYVDANDYGGFCDDAQRASWWDTVDGSDGTIDVVQRAQDEIHQWLRSGSAFAQRMSEVTVDNAPTLTLGELRLATAHLPDDVPITIAAPEGSAAEWYNLDLDGAAIPDKWPSSKHSSIILVAMDNYDSRQW